MKNKKWMSFDIEITVNPGSDPEKWAENVSGISCAAVAFSDRQAVKFWQGVPYMNQEQLQEMVADLEKGYALGYDMFTWNGCQFDFRVVAQLIEDPAFKKRVAVLNKKHYDLMQLFTYKTGHFLSLQKALVGCGAGSKKKTVRLNDGSFVEDMNGGKAPELWVKGEHEAVLSYLESDVREPLPLIRYVEEHGQIKWQTSSGKTVITPIELLPVAIADTVTPEIAHWVAEPQPRENFVKWMADL